MNSERIQQMRMKEEHPPFSPKADDLPRRMSGWIRRF